jgi:hypothetical protein
MDKLKYAYVPNVTQIRFFDFNDKRAPREYWSHINDIADLVAHRLCGMGSTYEHVGCKDDEVDAAVAAHDLLALPALGLGDAHAVGAGGDDWQGPAPQLETGAGVSAGYGIPEVSEWT